MKIEQVFNLMRNNKQVQITQEFREYWGKCTGRWFWILSISGNDKDGFEIGLQDKYHQIFTNAPLRALKPIK